ncbi:histidine kinase N-terminal 7TM domain-containing protein [Natrinema salsiterrestre]|uniref:histidine kinase n=1 Tax=Natrinema salsiterrestre TaxID=2950540 RepID=A0A9Q4KZB7_9EURY|nr:histidine kinase N-terminal 7TM domain-containing protein [Natrinema salsiterrestre]MDF9744562.1 PAS domain S-box protein [Natrinema salsiterrestre]
MSSPLFQFTPYTVPFIVGAAVLLTLAGYSIRLGRANGFDKTLLAFTATMASSALWSLARAIQLSTPAIELKQAALGVLYLGYFGAAIGLLCFALAFTGRKHLVTRKTVLLLSIVPLIGTALASTNWYHGLLWTLEPDPVGDILYIDRSFQPLFLVFFLYNSASSIFATMMLVKYSFTSKELYRRQTLAVSLGALFPIVAGILYVLEAYPLLPRQVDLTPIAFAITGLCFGYAIFKFRFLDIVPIARDSVVENMRDGYVVLDTADRIVDLNPAAHTIFQRGDEIIGDHVDTVLPAVESLVAEHEHGSHVQTELTVTTDDDDRFLIATVSTLSKDENRIGRLLTLRDVTDRHAVQKRYQELIENATDIIFVLNPDGTVTFASPSITRLFGVSPESIVGEDAFEYIHDEDTQAAREAFDRALCNPDAQPRVEYRLPDAAGEWRVVDVVVRNLVENSYVEGIVLNARDITERKERERELQRTNDQLEQFASVISHDLRNPLNVASGHLEVVRETGSTDSLDEIEHSLDRMETMIEDVLTLARQGKSIGEPERLSLETVARDAWVHVDTRDAELVVDTDRTVDGDPDRLLHLFENLFRNAIEHGDGDLTVTVSLEDDGFAIADDGPGIPETQRESVFDFGYTTTDSGTGFGLAIVAQIADAHGWDVSVGESESGGARISVTVSDPLAVN